MPDECDDSGAHEAKEPAHDSADAAGSPRLDHSPRPLRYLFYVVWVLTVPAALAVTAVHFSKPNALGVEVGVVRNFIGEQQVPATIMFFTLFAWVLWRIRYVMPFADSEWGEVGVAVIALHEGQKVTEEELKLHLRNYIAGYKLPKRIFVFDEIERASNGKVLKPKVKEEIYARGLAVEGQDIH